MNVIEVEVCREAMTVSLVRDAGGVFIRVALPDSDGSSALFPTNTSILHSFTKGFSYQVASSEGSLAVSWDDPCVVFRFESTGLSAKRCRIEKAVFEESLSRFSSSTV
ncbi:MAG TPA: hypothetical protein VG944_06320 [Fimbriimonas sp.]|nr:hypothetical protein [Fimbriimonas sp.]